MDDFQFIIESPQHNHGHKKRPRLVTSCDNCRLKKIKCLQPTSDPKCDACKAAKIPCRFRDRERYFAERSRAIAGPGAPLYGDTLTHPDGNPALDNFSAPSRSSSSSISPHSVNGRRSSSDSPTGSGDELARYQPYPPDPRRPSESYHRHTASSSHSAGSSGSDSAGYHFVHPSGSGPINNHHHQHDTGRRIHLFDPEHPQRPHPTLMPHFIHLFFEQLGAEFPFMSYEETMFFEQTLAPLLSNCIAALAARFSNLPELAVRGLHNVAETYGDNAKTILASVAHMPSMDTLYALILLSWSEYKNHRLAGFRSYCQLAMRMAVDLGLSEQSGVPLGLTDRERTRRRVTWSSVIQLNLAVTSFRS